MPFCTTCFSSITGQPKSPGQEHARNPVYPKAADAGFRRLCNGYCCTANHHPHLLHSWQKSNVEVKNLTPDQCLKKFGTHDMVVQPGGKKQINPFNGKPTTLKIRLCSRCGTSEMFFLDDPDSDSGSEDGGAGGCTCLGSAQDPYCPVHGWM